MGSPAAPPHVNIRPIPPFMPARSSPAETQTRMPIPGWRADWLQIVGGAVLAAGAIAVYSRTFSVPLLFDDTDAVAGNPTILYSGTLDTNRALQAEIVQRERAEEAHRQVLRRLVASEETERGRVSRELHDRLGQDLTALKLGLQVVAKQRPCPAAV